MGWAHWWQRGRLTSRSRDDYLAHSHRSGNGDAGQHPADQAPPAGTPAERDDGQRTESGVRPFQAPGGVSSNGRTPDSGSGSWGSNPCTPANRFRALESPKERPLAVLLAVFLCLRQPNGQPRFVGQPTPGLTEAATTSCAAATCVIRQQIELDDVSCPRRSSQVGMLEARRFAWVSAQARLNSNGVWYPRRLCGRSSL